MAHACGTNFESIESAHDYVSLLAETVADAQREIDDDIHKEQASPAKSLRRLEALRLVSYSLEKLAFHTRKSCRILNDLRSLRRLLFEERVAAAAAVAAAAHAAAAPNPDKPLTVTATARSRRRRPAPPPGSFAAA